jgi:hypothetical protein
MEKFTDGNRNEIFKLNKRELEAKDSRNKPGKLAEVEDDYNSDGLYIWYLEG